MADTPQGDRGGASYDNDEVLEAYLAHRHSDVSSPNVVMEEPAFLGELGDVSGRRVLDLGCGDGTFAQVVLDAPGSSYLGIDGSAKMVARARERSAG
jgi:predicted TPR repeat methyltransferase